MPENTPTLEAARTSIVRGGTVSTELGDQRQPQPKRTGQPAGRLKTICGQIAASALDILERME